MLESAESTCPYCGELVELSLDVGGGDHQAYVEDCPVCCSPWEVEAVRLESGQWEVMLRRLDE